MSVVCGITHTHVCVSRTRIPARRPAQRITQRLRACCERLSHLCMQVKLLSADVRMSLFPFFLWYCHWGEDFKFLSSR